MGPQAIDLATMQTLATQQTDATKAGAVTIVGVERDG